MAGHGHGHSSDVDTNTNRSWLWSTCTLMLTALNVKNEGCISFMLWSGTAGLGQWAYSQAQMVCVSTATSNWEQWTVRIMVWLSTLASVTFSKGPRCCSTKHLHDLQVIFFILKLASFPGQGMKLPCLLYLFEGFSFPYLRISNLGMKRAQFVIALWISEFL